MMMKYVFKIGVTKFQCQLEKQRLSVNLIFICANLCFPIHSEDGYILGPEINSQLLQMMTKIPPPSVTSVFATVVPELSHGDVVLAISKNG